MKLRSFVIMFAAICVLDGCAIAPGQHMSQDSIVRTDASEDGHVQWVPITPALLTQQQAKNAVALPRELLAYHPGPYRIGAGDTLYITVWDHPELTAPAGSQQQTQANGRLVRPDGTLFYPYVGLIHAAGMTIEALRTAITAKLARTIEQPQVDVTVIDFNSQRVLVEGAFVKTGPQSVNVVPLTLAQVLGTAIVNEDQAYQPGLILIRDGRTYPLDLSAIHDERHATPDIYVKAGDRLYLPYNDRKNAYVLGEVVQPRSVPFKSGDLTLTQTLGAAGGLNPSTSKGKAVYVIRGIHRGAGTPATIYHLDARSPSAYLLADEFKIKPDDVVFVGPAGITRWSRLISQLAPLSGLVNSAAAAQYYLNQ
jgi:polysaccharide biosynthesis/export protein